MAADIYTKGFTDSRKWDNARKLINALTPQERNDGMLTATRLSGKVPEEGCPSGGPAAAGGRTPGGLAAAGGPMAVKGHVLPMYRFVHACCEKIACCADTPFTIVA